MVVTLWYVAWAVHCLWHVAETCSKGNVHVQQAIDVCFRMFSHNTNRQEQHGKVVGNMLQLCASMKIGTTYFMPWQQHHLHVYTFEEYRSN